MGGGDPARRRVYKKQKKSPNEGHSIPSSVARIGISFGGGGENRNEKATT